MRRVTPLLKMQSNPWWRWTDTVAVLDHSLAKLILCFAYILFSTTRTFYTVNYVLIDTCNSLVDGDNFTGGMALEWCNIPWMGASNAITALVPTTSLSLRASVFDWVHFRPNDNVSEVSITRVCNLTTISKTLHITLKCFLMMPFNWEDGGQIYMKKLIEAGASHGQLFVRRLRALSAQASRTHCQWFSGYIVGWGAFPKFFVFIIFLPYKISAH